MRILSLIFALFFTVAVYAEGMPQPLTPFVNDYANLLDEETEKRLTRDLRQLRTETSVEMTIVTIDYISAHGEFVRIEPFATKLFNEWGIGNKDTNNGILVLIARQDREMRIELGAGYAPVYSEIAGAVIDEHAIPNFKADKYPEGIEEVTLATIERIAMPFSNGEEPKPPKKGFGNTIFSVIFGAFAGFGIFQKQITNGWNSMKRCPKCGARKMGFEEVITSEATKGIDGMKEKRVRCSNCDYEDTTRLSYSYKSASSSGSFGGGRSSGGGASGRW